MNHSFSISILSERINSLKLEITKVKELVPELYCDEIFIKNDIQNMKLEILSLQNSINILLKDEN